MTFVIESFRGQDIQTSVYSTRLRLSDQTLGRQASPVFTNPTTGMPRLARVQHQPAVIPLHVAVETATDANRDELLDLFEVGTRGPLEATVNGATRVIDCVVTNIVLRGPWGGGKGEAFVDLTAPDPRWREQFPTVTTENETGTLGTVSVTHSGETADFDPQLYVRPYTLKAASASYRYKREVVVAWRSPNDAPNYAVELTDGGWDHAAEVSAGRSDSSGDDVRVLVDGIEVPRWDGGGASTSWNDSGTKIWANVSFSAKREALLLANITATSPNNGEDLEVDPGGTDGFPRSGFVLIGSEVISYHGITRKNADGNEAFQNVVRGVRGTTAASHTDGDSIWYVEHRIQVMYGWTSPDTPPAADHVQPMLNLDTSTNTSHVWANFLDENNPGRSMQWARQLQNRDTQKDRILLPGGSPAADLTFEYQTDGAVAGKPNFNAVTVSVPAGTAQSGNAFSFTRAIDDTVGLKYYATDEDGSEVELEVEGGAQASGTKNIAADASTSYFSFTAYCRSQIVISNPSGSATTEDLLATGGATDWQQFTTPSAGKILGWLAQIRDGSAGNNTVTMGLYSDDGSDAPDYLMSSEPTDTTVFGSTIWLEFKPTSAAEVPTGTKLWIGAEDNVGTGNHWQVVTTIFSGGIRASGAAGGTQQDGVYVFRILSMDMDFYTGASADDGDTASLDDVTIALLSTTTPSVTFGSQQDAYFLDLTLANRTTVQEAQLQRLLSLSDTVEIDVRTRAVRNLTEGPLQVAVSGTVTEDTERSTPESSFDIQTTDGRVQMPSRYLDPTQGWVAFRLEMGANSGSMAHDPAVLFDWRDDANNLLQIRFDDTAGAWEFQRRNTGGTAEESVSDSFTSGLGVTVIAKWTATTVQLSVDGAAFESTANTNIPGLTAALMDLGSQAGASPIDSDVHWFACGGGTLTDADAADIDAWGNDDPDVDWFSDDAKVTAVWWARDRSYFAPLRVSERGRSVQTRSDGAQVFSDQAEWVRIDPGTNTLQVEESGLAGVRVEARHSDRW